MDVLIEQPIRTANFIIQLTFEKQGFEWCEFTYKWIFFQNIYYYVSVQFSSVAQPCPTLCDPMNHSTPGLPVHHQLPEFTQTHVHQVSDAIRHLILCLPLLLLPPIPPSIRVFSNESSLHMRWPNYWSFSFSNNPSNEHPGLISFRMDWLDLLAVQGTLKSLLQHHSPKASIFQCSAFFTVQLSHPYMTTGKAIALTRQTMSIVGWIPECKIPGQEGQTRCFDPPRILVTIVGYGTNTEGWLYNIL